MPPVTEGKELSPAEAMKLFGNRGITVLMPKIIKVEEDGVKKDRQIGESVRLKADMILSAKDFGSYQVIVTADGKRYDTKSAAEKTENEKQ